MSFLPYGSETWRFHLITEKKKRTGNFKPKGRIADKTAIDDVTDLLPNHLQRDMLIEYLHLIQDKYSFSFC